MINKNNNINNIFVSENEIQGIISRIADEINRDYKNKKLLICGILKGAFIFTADLVREIKSPDELEITFIKASSYGNSSVSSGIDNVKISGFFDLEKYKSENFEILIVDDILDSGNTLSFLEKYFKENGFENVNFCVLLNKPERRESEVYAKYIGKQIKNEFVVGYGLDFGEKYRNLPFIAALNTD